jgi:hypothetical protein
MESEKLSAEELRERRRQKILNSGKNRLDRISATLQKDIKDIDDSSIPRADNLPEMKHFDGSLLKTEGSSDAAVAKKSDIHLHDDKKERDVNEALMSDVPPMPEVELPEEDVVVTENEGSGSDTLAMVLLAVFAFVWTFMRLAVELGYGRPVVVSRHSILLHGFKYPGQLQKSSLKTLAVEESTALFELALNLDFNQTMHFSRQLYADNDYLSSVLKYWQYCWLGNSINGNGGPESLCNVEEWAQGGVSLLKLFLVVELLLVLTVRAGLYNSTDGFLKRITRRVTDMMNDFAVFFVSFVTVSLVVPFVIGMVTPSE